MSFTTRETMRHRGSIVDDPWELAGELSNGDQLLPLDVEGLPLLRGEEAYARTDAALWRWLAQEVMYEHSTVLGGGLLLTATSFIGNQRRRAAAEREAAPQWRPLGVCPVLGTDRRLLVWHYGAWWSVWYADVIGCQYDAWAEALTLTFANDAPSCLSGPGVAAFAVALAWIAATMSVPTPQTIQP